MQFAVEPETLAVRVIEMNPRVSRSSALASKATGVPIAKLAALLAVGYTLDELPNDITGTATAAFEPALDYVAVKAPRFEFEKFPWAERRLGAEMRAIGESLGLGRTFAEAFLKAFEGRETPPVAFDGRFARRSRCPSAGTCCSRRRGGGSTCRASTPTSPTGCASSRPRRRPRAAPRRLAVDSCAGEFDARTPYYYVTHEGEDEGPPPSGRAVIVLGGGPNRIGQAIEFDYCCVHAARALRTLGYEAVLVNSNPETVSTDYDSCDRLYLEPLTAARVLEICELEQPVGVAVSFGGQTPLGLAPALEAAGVPLLGEPLGAIHAAEDRAAFAALAGELAPPWGSAADAAEAREVADRIGYPVLVRPHHVLGGRGIHVARNADELDVTGPCLVDRFLEGALELDVDALCDGEEAWVAAVLEHVEPAGAHSGDSACVVPAPSVTAALEDEIRAVASTLARGLGARGLLNLQLAVARAAPVRARGEPARVAHGAVRGQGDGRAARRARGAAAARRPARRARPPGAGRADARVGEGGGVPGRAVPRRGRARARDAFDRRGHGRRPHAARGVRPGAASGRALAPRRLRAPPLQAARESRR